MSEIKTVVLDMDGTLYQIDGKDSGFSGSSLEQAVLENARTFVSELEDCSPAVANALITQGLKTPGGLSWFFAAKYGIAREDYFARTWQVTPDEIVQNYKKSVEVVKALKLKNICLILLTAAPSIWQRTVISFMGLEKSFDKIFTADDFSSKKEIFEQLIQELDPQTTISVGDQMESDIIPAQALGYQTLLVKNPADLETLLSMMEDK